MLGIILIEFCGKLSMEFEYVFNIRVEECKDCQDDQFHPNSKYKYSLLYTQNKMCPIGDADEHSSVAQLGTFYFE